MTLARDFSVAIVSSAVKIMSDILSRIFLAAVSCVILGKPHFFTAVSTEHQSAERSDKSGFCLFTLAYRSFDFSAFIPYFLRNDWLYGTTVFDTIRFCLIHFDFAILFDFAS